MIYQHRKSLKKIINTFGSFVLLMIPKNTEMISLILKTVQTLMLQFAFNRFNNFVAYVFCIDLTKLIFLM